MADEDELLAEHTEGYKVPAKLSVDQYIGLDAEDN